VRAWRGKGTRPAGVSSTDEYLALVRD